LGLFANKEAKNCMSLENEPPTKGKPLKRNIVRSLS
jgi:hypothetical protein